MSLFPTMTTSIPGTLAISWTLATPVGDSIITTTSMLSNGLAIIHAIATPDAGSLTATRAAPSLGRIIRPFDRLSRAFHIIHRRDDQAERADIGGVLDVPFLRVRQPDHGNGSGMRAGRDHRLDIFEFQRAVLHLKPDIVVMLGLL